MVFAAALAATLPTHAGSAELGGALPGESVVQERPVVLDTRANAPLELMLFVHRADLPLRPLPSKQKDNS